jgi:hypothetical protein
MYNEFLDYIFCPKYPKFSRGKNLHFCSTYGPLVTLAREVGLLAEYEFSELAPFNFRDKQWFVSVQTHRQKC